MPFKLKVYDNHHLFVKFPPKILGPYSTYDEALFKAKDMLDAFIEEHWTSGSYAVACFDFWKMFGENPVIVPGKKNKLEQFSAATYVSEIAAFIYARLEKQKDEIQTLYQDAIKFATAKHTAQKQKVPGTNLPYLMHLSNVAMEILIAGSKNDRFNTAFAVQVALLHDTLEDTLTTFDELKDKFGIRFAQSVAALSKNKNLPKAQQMQDSIDRIKEMQKEVWAVKLADRITNLQKPPARWSLKKKKAYHAEAKIILQELGNGNEYLAKRLEAKIKEYESYINVMR
jgi:guanosine-3',5'-bis(diphosphate) 3'-pyrophosphohydrolase